MRAFEGLSRLGKLLYYKLKAHMQVSCMAQLDKVSRRHRRRTKVLHDDLGATVCSEAQVAFSIVQFGTGG